MSEELEGEGRANFSDISKQKSWQEIFDIKEFCSK